MDAAAIDALNLRVLRRHDAATTAILDATAHVVVYDFDEARQQWNKRGIEGTLFIVLRDNSLLRHRLWILNRLGLEDLTLDLSQQLEVQTTGDYLIYKDPRDGRVMGLWIYEAQDRARLATSLREKCATSAVPQPTADTAGNNLLQLLLQPAAQGQTAPPHAAPVYQPPLQQQQQQQHQQQHVLVHPVPPLKHISAVWSVLDACIAPVHAPRSLAFDDFVARLRVVVDDAGFQRSLYDAYKTV